jgi:phosphopantothenoylcysteine decarboxylase/phosphopantothenate--cysteine ligase
VRHITNPSTGRMAIALAEQARAFGAHVHLVMGPTTLPVPEGPAMDVHRVTTAREMLQRVLDIQPNAALMIFAAAVSDWTPREPAAEKLRKEAHPQDAVLRVELVRTPDIALAAHQARRPGQVLVGFSAESRDPIPTALAKAARKGFDLVFANPIDQSDAGFGSATNHGWLIQPIPSGPNASDPTVEAVTVRSKPEVARLILQRAAGLLPRADQGA